MQVDWRQVGHVASAGALGGFLCWVYGETVGNSLGLGWFGSPAASIVLGTGAALLGVFLIAKTDLSATLHALSFALACGFAWRPVLEGASALVEAQVAESTQQSIEESTEDAVESSEGLSSGDEAERARSLEATVAGTVDALRVTPRHTDVAETRSADLEGVVRSIRAADGLDVGARIDGLRRIGTAAAAAGDQSVAYSSMAAIAELAESSGAADAAKEEAAEAVEVIGAMGSARRMQALEVNSDVIRESIRRRGDTSVRDIFDRRIHDQPR